MPLVAIRGSILIDKDLIVPHEFVAVENARLSSSEQRKEEPEELVWFSLN